MLKKTLIVPLLLVWCAFHLLTPFVAVCSTSCRGIMATPVAVPSSHACCLNSLKPITEIKTSPACVCPIMLGKSARFDTENVFSPLEVKDRVPPITVAGEVFFIPANVLDARFSPPGLTVFDPSDGSGIHSILRI